MSGDATWHGHGGDAIGGRAGDATRRTGAAAGHATRGDGAFDVCGPLPTGVTVLEASAGTGKTYTIAALAARYVAGGVPLERLLLVTFTRMATSELRERVRERLVGVERGLRRAAFAPLEPGGDPIVALLADGTPEQLQARRERLARAVADFDAATIATTHGFCQEALGGLGVAGDLEPDVAVVEDVDDLVAAVVDDLYVRRFHRGTTPAFARDEAARIVRAAVANPAAPIAAGDDGELPAMRRRLALAARGELERRKRRAALMTYDDLLTRLDAALADERVARRLRARYDVVLVDEFQDTDPIQWRIVRRAFGGGNRTLVLIGDPKQAIYSFRGADVHAYLDAAAEAGARATLRVNWRSDQRLLDAYDALFDEARLGHRGIVYRRVRAARESAAPRLPGAPLRLRVVARESVARTRGGYAQKASAREHVARDLAADVAALLASGAELAAAGAAPTAADAERPASDTTSAAGAERHAADSSLFAPGAAPGAGERLRPRHVAVLVRTNRTAALIREQLDAAGIPAVINGAGSVFATDAAREWLQLLEALERPASTSRAHAVALTCFLGWTPARVAAADEQGWALVHRRLHEWARVLRASGVASLLAAIALAESLPQRVLSTTDGERRLTDLRHVAQLLHAAASAEQLGTTALTAWLRRRIAEAGDDVGDEDRSRRLESDAEAVQVLTIHRSKGLEFPVVYLPFLWEPGFIPDEPQPVTFHDAGVRTLDVALEGDAFAEHRARAEREQRGEDLRLAYVALTRARHQAVVWWAPSWDSRNSPLGRLLFARDEDGEVASAGAFTPDDAATRRRLDALAAAAPGCVAVERSEVGEAPAWRPSPATAGELGAAAFDRPLDRRWRRTSYSDITAAAHADARVASEPESALLADEPDAGLPTIADATALAPPPPTAEPPPTSTPPPAASAPPPAASARPLTAAAPATAAPSPTTAPSPTAAPPPTADAPPLPLAAMPAGVQVGTLIHRVFERSDFAAPDLDGELRDRLAAAQAWRAVELGGAGAVVRGLRAVIQTPLGPLLGGRRLRDVARADRLDELAFELPLAGGERATGTLKPARIGALLRAHLPADDPLAPYAARLQDPALRQGVRGYLTGSLDLVVRVPGATPRFAVVDYKTNWLAGPGEPLTAAHYRPTALAEEMLRRHYGLQALLYTVALHRYLRWRLPGYDPARNLAGVLYLFIRGMTGGDAPAGVFSWSPPAPLVVALSDLLGEGAA